VRRVARLETRGLEPLTCNATDSAKPPSDNELQNTPNSPDGVRCSPRCTPFRPDQKTDLDLDALLAAVQALPEHAKQALIDKLVGPAGRA
jgi:hypothetical protein